MKIVQIVKVFRCQLLKQAANAQLQCGKLESGKKGSALLAGRLSPSSEGISKLDGA